MRIGISAIGYQCEEHIDKVLKPWIKCKKSFEENKTNEFFISISHGVFPETYQLGFPVFSTDKTIDKLKEYETNKDIDYLQITNTPTFEKDLRNITLQYLFYKNIDILWLLDLQDEIYTEEAIYNILNYAQSSEDHWFKINFKNYIFDESTYIDDFIAPRIWKNSVNQGINSFYYDNEIIFNNGLTANKVPHSVVPKDIAFIKHLSWVGSKDYLKRKIDFQKIHYGQCSYIWNDLTNKLEFHDDYYFKFNKQKPIIYKD